MPQRLARRLVEQAEIQEFEQTLMDAQLERCRILDATVLRAGIGLAALARVRGVSSLNSMCVQPRCAPSASASASAATASGEQRDRFFELRCRGGRPKAPRPG